MITKVKFSSTIRGGIAGLVSGICIGPVAAQELPPSGLPYLVHEVLIEEGLARFRFVLDGLGTDGRGFDEVEDDFAWLCAQMIVPALTDLPQVTNIVLSVADREVTFGELAPEATQYFEAFRLENGSCIWEQF